MNQGESIVFFDGVCNLCNSWVQWVLKRDKNGIVKFSSLQSVFAKDFIKDPNVLSCDSIVFYHDNKFYIKSHAVLKLLWKLGFPYSLALVFTLVPRFIRDAVYDWVAKNRYKWYGRRAECMIPDPAFKDRFLE